MGCTSEMNDAMQVSEGKEGKLQGTARVGKQVLGGLELAGCNELAVVRRLTWRLVHHSMCFYLTLTFSQKFARATIAVNGFIVLERRHGMFSQVRACSSSKLMHVHDSRCVTA